MTRTLGTSLFPQTASRLPPRLPQQRVVLWASLPHPRLRAVRTVLRPVARHHLLVIDLLPPTPRDPHGMHKAIWDEIEEEPFELPPDKPLTLAAYVAGDLLTGVET